MRAYQHMKMVFVHFIIIVRQSISNSTNTRFQSTWISEALFPITKISNNFTISITPSLKNSPKCFFSILITFIKILFHDRFPNSILLFWLLVTELYLPSAQSSPPKSNLKILSTTANSQQNFLIINKNSNTSNFLNKYKTRTIPFEMDLMFSL